MHFFRQSCYFIALNKRALVIFSSKRPLVAISFFPIAEKSCLLNSNAVQTQALVGDGASPDTYCHRFGLLPVRQQVRGAVLHRAVLLHDLHLEVGHLLLDGGVFALHDVAEGAPLALDVIDVEPGRRELEALLLQQTLAVTEQLRKTRLQSSFCNTGSFVLQ